MKTVIIPIITRTNIELLNRLEEIGLFNLIRKEPKEEGKKGFPIAFDYINGISENPEYINDNCHVYKEFNEKYFMWHYFRINLTEKGEQILKNNNINYFYDL